MSYKSYTVIMERIMDDKIIREQVRAYSVRGILQCIRAYKMANLGWEVSKIPYNDRIRKILGEI